MPNTETDFYAAFETLCAEHNVISAVVGIEYQSGDEFYQSARLIGEQVQIAQLLAQIGHEYGKKFSKDEGEG
jgi:hypothetical protein